MVGTRNGRDFGLSGGWRLDELETWALARLFVAPVVVVQCFQTPFELLYYRGNTDHNVISGTCRYQPRCTCSAMGMVGHR